MTHHQPAQADDVPLPGGRMTSGIVRRGHRLPPYARTDLALRGAAELLRRLHLAAAGFQPAMTSYRSLDKLNHLTGSVRG